MKNPCQVGNLTRNFMRKAIFFVIILIFFCFQVTACVVVNERGEEIAIPDEITHKGREWRLDEMPIQLRFSEEESAVPLLIVPVPPDMNDSFILPGLPDVMDQRPQASGSAFAIGYLANTMLQRVSGKESSSYVCSPSYIYNSLNEGKDQGVSLLRAAFFLKESGCADLKWMPFRNYDYRYQPSVEANLDASRYKINGFGRVDYTDINQVKGQLSQGRAVSITVRLYENFVTLKKMHWNGPMGSIVGHHSLSVVGYDDDEAVFIVQNSAGSDWGSEGRAAIPYAWFIRIVETAYVIW